MLKTVLWIAGTQIHVLATDGQLKMKADCWSVTPVDCCTDGARFPCFPVDRAFPVCIFHERVREIIAERNPNQLGGPRRRPLLLQNPLSRSSGSVQRERHLPTRVFGRGKSALSGKLSAAIQSLCNLPLLHRG